MIIKTTRAQKFIFLMTAFLLLGFAVPVSPAQTSGELMADAKTLLEKKDFAGALKELNEVIKLEPKMVAAYQARGDANLKLHNWQEAADDYSAAKNLGADNSEIYKSRANAYYKLSNYNAALADLRRALVLEPNNDSIRDNIDKVTAAREGAGDTRRGKGVSASSPPASTTESPAKPATGVQSASLTNQFADADAKVYAEIKAALEKYDDSIKGNGSGEQYGTPDKNPINFDDLLRRCEMLISHNSRMPDYYRLRGKVRYDRAIAGTPYIFTESLSLTDPKFIAKFPASDVAAGIKDFSDALSADRTLKLDDIDAADAHLFRGKLYAISAAQTYSKQNLQNALVDFDDFVSMDEYELPPDGFRKGIYLLSRDGDLVGQDFAGRIKEDPSAARHLYLERAGYYTEIVDYSRALADLLRYADSSAPGDTDDLAIVKLRYAALNITAVRVSESLNLLDAENNLETAAFYVQFPDKQEQALKNATDALERNPRLTAAHVIRAKVLLSKGQVDEAMTAANAALAQDADNVGALCIRGLGYAIKNDIRTLDDFNRAIALDPELAFLYNAFGNRARIYTALGKADLAAADTQKSAQIGKKLAEIRQ